MSTISNAMPSSEAVAGTFVRVIGQTLKHCWVSYATWRSEQIAVSQLRSMSDRELKDIGVSRAGIEFAVCGTPIDRAPICTVH